MSLLIQVLAFEQILKRARTKRSAEMQILIGGIGIATIPLAIAQHETKSNPFGFSQSTFDVNVWQVGDVRITNIAVITIVVGIALWAAMALWFRRSKHGLALRSIGVDSEVASLMGINRRQLALVTMAVSGGMAGLAGCCSPTRSARSRRRAATSCSSRRSPSSSSAVSARWWGSPSAPSPSRPSRPGSCENTSGSWTDAVAFGLIFLVLLARPSGVFGRKEVRRA